MVAFAQPNPARRRPKKRRQRKERGKQPVQCQTFNGNRCTICGSCMDEGGICNNMHESGCWYKPR